MAAVRLLLIANIKASTVNRRRIAFIRRALAEKSEVDLVHTKRQGHAMQLAKGAVHEGYDLVVAMGGDGTANETANGLAGSQTPMAIVPGGGTNVLARSMGIPLDTVKAAGHLLGLLGTRPRRVALGRADGRFFTFTCGLGLDGGIVRQVEKRQDLKKTAGQGYYVWTGLRLFFFGYDRRRPRVSVRWGPDLEHRRDGLFLAISQKRAPFTYLAKMPMKLCPEASIDRGLDCFALDSMQLPLILRLIGQMFTSAGHVRNSHVLYLRDQPKIEISCDAPMPVQMDGEYIGERDRLTLECVPDALSLLA